mmetsp:Transcript_33284/g.72642  ORF Transcript_33284/g.72642 Transcript_33284/m.72642 type:complete len:653 (+) Transcript_33284:49-2007(+)
METKRPRLDTAARKPALRVASLLPSATEILGQLGLGDSVVGVTHECDVLEEPGKGMSTNRLPAGVIDGSIGVITVSHIDPEKATQREIDAAVKASLQRNISLYEVDEAALAKVQPDLIVTQTLCDVCAPAINDVRAAIARMASKSSEDIQVMSLEPTTIREVAESFVTVAEACGVKERGEELQRKFLAGFEELQASTGACSSHPTVLMLEWLDPPFDAGHWVPEMIVKGGGRVALGSDGGKSKETTWEAVNACDPDVVVVACCGFDLKRNIADAVAQQPLFKSLRAYREGRIFACDGNRYFARPGPSLLGGAALVARCAFDGDTEVVAALERLSFMPQEGLGWQKITDWQKLPEKTDVEDLADWMALHKAACEKGLHRYTDPATGYFVMTEIALKERGKCCGSGCRHCPYQHENLKDKAGKSQMPCFLHQSGEGTFLSPATLGLPIKILFFSGGKDSFLALRALAAQASKGAPFAVVLMTTFDAVSRIIAHQEMHIRLAVQQASFLDVTLVGVPLQRGSKTTYVQSITKGLDVVQGSFGKERIEALVFGDLHLEHIKEWRDSEVGALGIKLEYPLWKKPYEDLMAELEASTVPCVVSSSTVDGVKEGQIFSRQFFTSQVPGLDAFGENGEFHTTARVWEARSREVALGLSPS